MNTRPQELVESVPLDKIKKGDIVSIIIDNFDYEKRVELGKESYRCVVIDVTWDDDYDRMVIVACYDGVVRWCRHNLVAVNNRLVKRVQLVEV